ncbi:MAG TPA: ATP-binding cassette domain-containing protein [Anaerolineae bacterium]|nr:ATP-binding cassette domain-containing protein [Anaerolineae bacterium]HQH39692.1 ATP-binding cassette domain-containing protein [Anaerolineae bacterium]
MQPLLRAEQLRAVQGEGEGLTLTLTAGDRVGILGTADSGKTALLRVLARLQFPVRGRLWWRDVDVTHKARRLLGKQRTFVALLSANPYTSFAPWAAVRPFFTSSRQTSPRLAELFKGGGIPPIAVDGTVGALSGVERVRLALLYALQNDPRIVLVDDVFRWIVPEMWQPLVDELDARTGVTRALVVASQYWQALQTMEHILVLSKGTGVEWGSRETMFTQPQQRVDDR